MKFFKRAKRIEWWLVFGLVGFFSVSLSSIIRSFDAEYLLSLSLEWFAASVIYFFFSALVGHVVDWLVFGKKGHPEWAMATCLFWIVSTVSASIYAGKSPLIDVFFPIVYGIFFLGFAFVTLLPWLSSSTAAKLVFDSAFLLVFFSWLYFRKKRFARLLLLTIFFVFLAGLYGCLRAI